jgi:hypothetical protein
MTWANLRLGSRYWLVLVALGTMSLAPVGRADVLFTNFDQPDRLGDWFEELSVGVAVQVANSSLNVTSVLLDQSRTTSDPTGGEVLGVFAQNPDGSAGNVVFQNFSLSYNPANGVTTATASAPLILAANTAYWLRLDTTTSNNIIWNALHAPTSPNEFTSAFGVTYASPDSVTITDSTAGTQYGPTVDGPPVIQINGTAIPEPAGMLLVSGAALAGLLTRSKRQF